MSIFVTFYSTLFHAIAVMYGAMGSLRSPSDLFVSLMSFFDVAAYRTVPDRINVALFGLIAIHMAVIMVRKRVLKQEAETGFVPLITIKTLPTAKICRGILYGLMTIILSLYMVIVGSDATPPMTTTDALIFAIFAIVILGTSGFLDESIHRRLKYRIARKACMEIAQGISDMLDQKVQEKETGLAAWWRRKVLKL